MPIHLSQQQGPYPYQQPEPPPPPIEILPEATPDEANGIIKGMDEQAHDQFSADVQDLPAGERQELLNGLATRLDAENMAALHDAFGSDAVADAVELRSAPEVRSEYRELTGTAPELPNSPNLPPAGVERVEAPQIKAAQDDFKAGNIGSGSLAAGYQLGTLAAEHSTEPAYLAELVRLADEAGVLDGVMGVNAGLYSRDADGNYALSGAEADAARDGLVTAIGVAVERGVLTEGAIRHLAADQGLVGWADVAGQLGIQQVGRTAATDQTATELQDLQEAHAEAKAEADKLDEELNTFLLRAGPLTAEQQAAFIEDFRTSDDHADVYSAEVQAGQDLADYMVENRDDVLTAAVQDPAIAQQVVDTLGSLADSGHGELALELLGEILATEGSALNEAFSAHTDTLQGELFERISSAAAVEILAGHDGDLEAAVEDLKEAFQPFRDVKGLFDGVKGGIDGFNSGLEMMEAVAAGDFDALQKLADGFGDSSSFSRAMSAVGLVLGAVKAGQSGQDGEYLAAVQGFASAGESGLNLLAGATKHLADAGRLAQYGDDAVRFATFASRLAPGLGVIASATSMVINAQKAGDDGNFGYAIAAMGDAFGVMGSAVALVPGAGTAAGAIVSGIGAVISVIGGAIGDAIDRHQTAEELRGYLEAAGLDPETIDLLMGTGEAQNEVAAELGLSGEQWQQMLAEDPMLAYAPHMFKEVADAYGLEGEQVLEMFSRLREENPDAIFELIREFGEQPTLGVNYGPAVQQFLESDYPSAHEYGRSQQISDTEPDGTPKPPVDMAEDDYSAIRDGSPREIFDAAEELLAGNDDHDYRVRIVQLLYADSLSEAALNLGMQYGVQPDEVIT